MLMGRVESVVLHVAHCKTREFVVDLYAVALLQKPCAWPRGAGLLEGVGVVRN